VSRVLTTWPLVYEALKDAREEKKVASAIQKNFVDAKVPSEECLPGVVYDDPPTQISVRSVVSTGTQTDNSDDDHKELQSGKESEGETVISGQSSKSLRLRKKHIKRFLRKMDSDSSSE